MNKKFTWATRANFPRRWAFVLKIRWSKTWTVTLSKKMWWVPVACGHHVQKSYQIAWANLQDLTSHAIIQLRFICEADYLGAWYWGFLDNSVSIKFEGIVCNFCIQIVHLKLACRLVISQPSRSRCTVNALLDLDQPLLTDRRRGSPACTLYWNFEWTDKSQFLTACLSCPLFSFPRDEHWISLFTFDSWLCNK